MNVLSLFDGMSCGRIALERAGIHVDNYYASEIDKYAIKVSKANYPDIIQLGDVGGWREWGLPKIDLILAGSPCQGFSFAGKQLAFNDPRSKLFFTFIDIAIHHVPKFFLLENVKMKKEYQDIISMLIGYDPIEINSALVSAQNRKRLYWINIPDVMQPEDREIYLKDILICGDIPYLKVSKAWNIKKHQNKASCLIGGAHSGGNYSDMDILVFEKPHGYVKGGVSLQTKFSTLRSCTNYNYAINNGFDWRRLSCLECERLQTVPDGYTDHVSNTQQYKMLGNGWTVDVIVHILRRIT